MKLNEFQKEYQNLARDVIKDLNRQMSYISTNGDLRIAFRNLRKLENRLRDEENILQEEKNFQRKFELE